MLPACAACRICEESEAPAKLAKNIDSDGEEERDPEIELSLYECGVCWRITHICCYRQQDKAGQVDYSKINEDLPNSWECPECVNEGMEGMSQVT